MKLSRQFYVILISYFVLQIGGLLLKVGLFVILNFLIYSYGTIYAIVDTFLLDKTCLSKFLKRMAVYILHFFLVNLALFVIYLPTIIYNPDINWKLKGEYEQDPMILQAYIPIVLFCLSLFCLIIEFIVFLTLYYLYSKQKKEVQRTT